MTSDDPLLNGSLERDMPIYARIVYGEQKFTCPRCGKTSYNPNDVREGYCSKCHDWIGERL